MWHRALDLRRLLLLRGAEGLVALGLMGTLALGAAAAAWGLVLRAAGAALWLLRRAILWRALRPFVGPGWSAGTGVLFVPQGARGRLRRGWRR